MKEISWNSHTYPVCLRQDFYFHSSFIHSQMVNKLGLQCYDQHKTAKSPGMSCASNAHLWLTIKPTLWSKLRVIFFFCYSLTLKCYRVALQNCIGKQIKNNNLVEWNFCFKHNRIYSHWCIYIYYVNIFIQSSSDFRHGAIFVIKWCNFLACCIIDKAVATSNSLWQFVVKKTATSGPFY